MYKTFFLLILVCLFVQVTSSQLVKMRGKVMLNDSSELTGWIDYDDWEEAPSEILFFADSVDRNGKRYQISNLRYFEVFGHQAYTRVRIRNECNNIRQHLQRQSKLYTRFITEDVFLKIVVHGAYMLAELKHYHHNHLFLYFKTTGWEQLKLGGYTDGDGYYIENDQYKDQLIRQMAIGTFDDSTKIRLLGRIQRAKQNDLTSIIKEFNNAIPVFEHPDHSRQLDQVSASIGGGLGYSVIRFEDGRPATSAGPIAAVLGNLDFGPSIFKNGLIFRMSFSFVSHHYRNFYFYSISPGFSLMYSALLRRGSRLYAGAGAQLYNSFMGREADRKLKEAGARLDFGRTWLSTTWKAGLLTNMNWEFGLEGIIYAGVSNADMRWPTPTAVSLYVARHLVISKPR